jgi:TolB-like protein
VSLFAELQRRNVIRVGVFYLIAAWLIIQVAETVLPLFAVPEGMLRGLVILLAIGFVPALVFSWIYELTPEGVKRESEIDRNESITPVTGRKLNLAIFAMLSALVALMAWQQFAPRPVQESSSPAGREDSNRETPMQGQTLPVDLSIAVLPFANLSSDEENEYFADGLTEELLNLLAQIESLKVAGRTSSFYFKGKNESLQSIGRQLNVAHVLEGSIRRSGDRLRITAQLIKVDDGYHLWSQTYDRVMDDVFAIQDDIARAITEALKIKLDLTVDQLAPPTRNTEAYTLYILGRQKWNTRVSDEVRQAIDLFRQAVELDPEFALAWSGLADAIDALAWREVTAWELIPEAFDAARRAIELAPGEAAGYASLGILKFEFGYDLEGGSKDLAQALALNPNYLPALHWSLGPLRNQGRIDEELEICERALAMDPLAVITLTACGKTFFEVGNNDELAFELWTRSLRISPDLVNMRFGIPLNGTWAGNMDAETAGDHLTHWARLREVPDPSRVRVFFELREKPELRPGALDLIAELNNYPKVDPLELLSLYVHVGEFDPALDLFEAAFEARNPQLYDVTTKRRFPNELLDHPRFEAVVRKAGFLTRRELLDHDE